jgi:hypothetical protein
MDAGDPATVSVAKLKRKIQSAIRAKRYEQAVAAAQAMAEAKSVEAAKTLFDLGLRIAVPEFYNKVPPLLAAIDGEEVFAFYEDMIRKSDERIHMYVLEVLGSMQHPRAVDLTAALLRARSPHVLRAAVAALGRLRRKECVEPLLAFLAKLEKIRERGLLYQETRDALFAITRQDFDSIDDWGKWWKTVKDTFDPDKEDQGRTAVVRPRRDKAPVFVGRRIFSKRALFIIDTSGSMDFVMKDDIPGLTWKAGSDGSSLEDSKGAQLNPHRAERDPGQVLDPIGDGQTGVDKGLERF